MGVLLLETGSSDNSRQHGSRAAFDEGNCTCFI